MADLELDGNLVKAKELLTVARKQKDEFQILIGQTKENLRRFQLTVLDLDDKIEQLEHFISQGEQLAPGKRNH